MLLAESNIPLGFAHKPSCLPNESLASQFLRETVQIMKNDFCSFSTRGSNDTGVKKMNPLTV